MKTTDLLRWTTASITVLVLCAGAPACGAVSATQCSTDDECIPILGVTADRAQCVAGVCQVKIPPVDNPPDAGPSCSTNDECTATNGSASICREQTCVRLLNDVVTQSTDNYKGQKDAVVLGVVLPLTDGTGSPSPFDKTYADGVRLAIEDWSGGMGGGGLLVGTERRPVVAVFCDSQHDATRVQKCVDHMTSLKAPAIVFRASDDTNSGGPRAVQANTLVYCSDCEPHDVSLGNTNGLLWFGAPSLESQIPIRASWIQKLEPDIHKEAGRAPGALRMTLLSTTDLNYGADVKNALQVNGASVDWHNLDVKTTDWHALGAQIVGTNPDIVVTADLGSFFATDIVPEVEKRWNSQTMGPPPRYVASESEAFDQGLEQLIGANDALRKRITGVWSAEVSDAVISNEEQFFESAFLARFNYRAGGVCTGYESLYALQFAMVAAQSGAHTTTLRGDDLREGLKRLVGGPQENAVDFKPSEIKRGVTLLQQQQVVDARGLASDLDWDPITGIPQAGAGVWCAARQGNGLKVEELWSYDYKKKAPVGDPDTSVCGF